MVFGKAKSPVDLVTQGSLEYGLQWIAENFGARKMLDAKVVDASEAILEIRSPLGNERFSQIVDFLATQLGVDPEQIVIHFNDEHSYSLFHIDELRELDEELTEASLQEKIQIAYQSRHPSDILVIDVSIWLASFLYDARSFEHCPFAKDMRVLDEFLCLFQGMGPVFSRHSLTSQKERASSFAEAILGFPVYSDVPQKHLELSTIDLGAVLGLIQFALREPLPSWHRKLRGDVNQVMKSMVRFLENSEPYFGPDSLFHKKTIANTGSFYDLLKSTRPVDKIIALNSLFPQLDVDSVELSGVLELSRSKHSDLRCAATFALKHFAAHTQRDLPDEIRNRLLQLVEDSDGRVKSLAAYGLATQRLNESTVSTLCVLLHDSDREVAQAAGFALRQSATFAERVIPEICKAIAFCVIRGEASAMETMVDTLDEICEFPEEHLVKSLDHNEHDFLFAVTDVLREIRKAKRGEDIHVLGEETSGEEND